MSLKKYMLIDLLITGIIGIIVEFFGVFVFNKMIYATIIPYAISLLIMMISTTRWGNYGLILVPFLALSTVLSGKLINPTDSLKVFYDWKLYLSLIVSLSTFSLNFCWFDYKKKRKKKETMGSMAGLACLDIVVATLMLVLVYYLLTGNMFILAFPVWSLYGYAMLILGTCILFTQGVLVNVKNKFLEEKDQMCVEEDFHMCLDEEEDSGVEKGVLECKK
jgi:hypothetical protein